LTTADAKAIELFVRGTLGCRCPEEVFSDITIAHERNTDSGVTYTRLVLGNRLLVYVLDAQHSSALRADVAMLTTRGCADRNSNHLNRFRLVLTADRLRETQAEVDTTFSAAAGHDDHAHLHVVATDQLPRPLRTP
jgi:hypothetical protein